MGRSLYFSKALILKVSIRKEQWIRLISLFPSLSALLQRFPLL